MNVRQWQAELDNRQCKSVVPSVPSCSSRSGAGPEHARPGLRARGPERAPVGDPPPAAAAGEEHPHQQRPAAEAGGAAPEGPRQAGGLALHPHQLPAVRRGQGVRRRYREAPTHVCRIVSVVKSCAGGVESKRLLYVSDEGTKHTGHDGCDPYHLPPQGSARDRDPSAVLHGTRHHSPASGTTWYSVV